MKLELQQFPIERLYFLESKEFLDKEEKIFLKQNSSFKLNSYYLGMSKRRVNNDKMLYLFNGLRGYYEVNSRFVKNPKIMEIRPPMSKYMYKLFFKRRKYKYQDLIIYSLKLFTRPTITLTSDKDSGELYHFPYKLLEFLNENRTRFLIKKNYNFWKKDVKSDFKFLKLNLFIRLNRFNKKSYRRLQFTDAYILGYVFNFVYLNSGFLNSKLAEKKLLLKNFFFSNKKRNRKLKKRTLMYKTLRTIQSWLIRKKKIKSRRRSNFFTKSPLINYVFVGIKKKVFLYNKRLLALKMNRKKNNFRNKKKKFKLKKNRNAKQIAKKHRIKLKIFVRKVRLFKLIKSLRTRLKFFSVKGISEIICKRKKIYLSVKKKKREKVNR